MMVGLGLLILAIIFIAFGSQNEEASVLYYDEEDTGNFDKAQQDADSVEEEGEVINIDLASKAKAIAQPEDVVAPKKPAKSSGDADAAKIARQIYDDITL